jgi:hypothetical protein
MAAANRLISSSLLYIRDRIINKITTIMAIVSLALEEGDLKMSIEMGITTIILIIGVTRDNRGFSNNRINRGVHSIKEGIMNREEKPESRSKSNSSSVKLRRIRRSRKLQYTSVLFIY